MRCFRIAIAACFPMALAMLSFVAGCLAHERNQWAFFAPPEFGSVPEATDALDEANAARAAKRLPPFKRDNGLTEAAKKCASYRADHLCGGHTKNDFAFIPNGTKAEVAGCAAWPESWGWGACETYRRSYQHAGAAWAKGRDRKRYMHLFLR